MTDVSYPRAAGPRPDLKDATDQAQARTLVSIAPSTRSEMHELGNLIVALQFCLRQLGGCQRTDELEGVVRTGLEVCQQGIAVFRKVNAAVGVRH